MPRIYDPTKVSQCDVEYNSHTCTVRRIVYRRMGWDDVMVVIQTAEEMVIWDYERVDEVHKFVGHLPGIEMELEPATTVRLVLTYESDLMSVDKQPHETYLHLSRMYAKRWYALFKNKGIKIKGNKNKETYQRVPGRKNKIPYNGTISHDIGTLPPPPPNVLQGPPTAKFIPKGKD